MIRLYRSLLSILTPLVLAALACNAPLPSPGDQATPTSTEPPPTSTPTRTPRPTHQPATNIPTGTPGEPTATLQVQGGITQDSFPDLTDLRNLAVSSSVLFEAQFSPDGEIIATFGLDKRVRLYDAEDLDFIAELTGLSDYGLDLAWSPDGERIAAGGGFALIIWNAGSLRQMKRIPAYPQRQFDLAWSPDGDRILVAGLPSSHIQIMDANTGAIRKDMQPTPYITLSADWSSTGLIAAADNEDHVVIYDTEHDFRELYRLTATGAAFHMTFSPDGSRLVGCHEGGSFDLWDTEDGSTLANGPTGLSDCFATAWSPDSTLLYIGGSDPSDRGLLVAYDAETGSQVGTYAAPEMIWSISTSPDGQLLALALNDGTMVILGLP